MLHAYINYPNSHITIHNSQECNEIMKQPKEGRRVIQVNPHSFSCEIEKFISGKHKFASDASCNDMWIEVDFDNIVFERNIIDYIHVQLQKKYTPFREIEIDKHC